MAPELWLRRYAKVPDPRLRLACFPHAGGSASAYVPFAPVLAEAGVEVLAVQYPARQDRRTEPAVPSLTGLAGLVAPVLQDLPGGPPLALFGHSMGATVAYETGRLLQAADRSAAHLVVSGRRPPTEPPMTQLFDVADDAALLREVARLQGTDAALLADPEIRAMILPALRMDYRGVADYRHAAGPPLDCPITVFAAEDDPQGPPAELSGWAGLTTARSDLYVFPGGHFYLTKQVPDVCHALLSALL